MKSDEQSEKDTYKVKKLPCHILCADLGQLTLKFQLLEKIIIKIKFYI